MEKNQILEQIEGMPTLVGKLRFIEGIFPTDDASLKKVAQKAQIASIEKEMPLFAGHIEVPEVTEMSRIDVWCTIAHQVGFASHYSDLTIEQYSQNPVVSGALQGDRVYKRFNKDRRRWEQNKGNYAELIGNEKPKKSPRPKVSKDIRRIFYKAGLDSSLAKKCFAQKELGHPVVYLDKKIYEARRREVNRSLF